MIWVCHCWKLLVLRIPVPAVARPSELTDNNEDDNQAQDVHDLAAYTARYSHIPLSVYAYRKCVISSFELFALCWQTCLYEFYWLYDMVWEYMTSALLQVDVALVLGRCVWSHSFPRPPTSPSFSHAHSRQRRQTRPRWIGPHARNHGWLRSRRSQLPPVPRDATDAEDPLDLNFHN